MGRLPLTIILLIIGAMLVAGLTSWLRRPDPLPAPEAERREIEESAIEEVRQDGPIPESEPLLEAR